MRDLRLYMNHRILNYELYKLSKIIESHVKAGFVRAYSLSLHGCVRLRGEEAVLEEVGGLSSA